MATPLWISVTLLSYFWGAGECGVESDVYFTHLFSGGDPTEDPFCPMWLNWYLFLAAGHWCMANGENLWHLPQMHFLLPSPSPYRNVKFHDLSRISNAKWEIFIRCLFS
jgi:hypothetical protein